MGYNYFRVSMWSGLALLLILPTMVLATQQNTVSHSGKDVIPITRNFNLSSALRQLTRPGAASASAAGFLYIQNPVASAILGKGSTTTTTTSTLGEWGFGTVGGDPATTVDDNFTIIAATRAGIFDQGANSEMAIGSTGIMTTQPYFNANSQKGGWVWNSNVPLSNFKVELKLSLVRDILFYEYDITNLNSDFRQVGFDWTAFLNTFSSQAGNAPTYYIPNMGSYNTIQLFTGTQVPDHWFLRDGTASVPPDNHPPLQFEQLFNGTNSRPSQIVFANYGVSTTTTGSTTNSNLKVDDLSAYNWQEVLNAQANPSPTQTALITTGGVWKVNSGTSSSSTTGAGPTGTTTYECLYPITGIAPGQTQAITGQIQCNWASVNTIGTYPNPGVLAAALHVPEWISTQASTLKVDAFLCNSANLFDTPAKVTINPGSGFSLASGQNATITNITVPKSTDHQVSWTLVPNWSALNALSPSKPITPLGYPITLTTEFAPGGTTSKITTTAYINVPTVPASQSLPAGLHFVGWPFQFKDTTPSAVLPTMFPLSRPTTTGVLSNDIAWYDPTKQIYQYGDDPNATISFTPCNAYWIMNTSTVKPASSNTATPLSQNTTVSIPLYYGWNAISNPYEYAIVWGYCQVMYNYQMYSLSDAINQGLIRGEIWSWNDTTQTGYNLPNSDLNQLLTPNVGYFLYAGNNESLVFTPNPYLSVMRSGKTVTTSPAARKTTRTAQTNQWQINIITQAGTAVDHTTSFGVAPNQKNGPSGDNIMKAPIHPQGVSAYFPHTNWGRMSGQYAVELQAPATTNTWALDVTCAQPKARVTLSWPDLTGIPAKMPVILTDLTTGQQISLRTSPGYSFTSGKGEVRHFSITAGGFQTALQFTQVQAVANRARGGATVHFGLSADADVQLNLRTPTGRLIRTLELSRAVRGSNAILWDGRDAQGHILPRGIYLGELFAQATDGQCVRASLMLNK